MCVLSLYRTSVTASRSACLVFSNTTSCLFCQPWSFSSTLSAHTFVRFLHLLRQLFSTCRRGATISA